MKLAGIQKHTLVDYPGKIACIIFTQGCNFRCGYCHNSECVLPEKTMLLQHDLIPEEVFFNFLETRKGFLDGVSICGGEPTLHPDLYDFAKKIKQMGFSVKLDTNGRDYEIVKKLVDDGIVDYVAIDLKHSWDGYAKAIGIPLEKDFVLNYEKLWKLLSEGNIDYEYRTTIIKGMHTSEDIEKMAKYITGAKHYYLQNYVAGNTLEPNFEGTSFEDEELLEFQKIANRYVKHVGIRK